MRVKLIVFPLFPILLMIDYVTTALVLRLGGYEQNTFLRWIIEMFGLSGLLVGYVISVSAYTVALVLIELLSSRMSSRTRDSRARALLANTSTVFVLTLCILELYTVIHDIEVFRELIA